MSFLDRIFGRSSDLSSESQSRSITKKDARAVDLYERMVRTMPPNTIDQSHVEAFEKLTPVQLDILFGRFNERGTEDDRPSDARPVRLKRSATATEVRPQAANPTLSSWMKASLLDSVAWYGVASNAWSLWYFVWAYDTYESDLRDAPKPSSDKSFDEDLGW